MSDWECTLESKKEIGFKKALREMNELKAPIGIAVFGADCDFKQRIIEVIHREIVDSTIPINDNDWDGGMNDVGFSQLIYLNGDDSGLHERRHKLVERLRNTTWCTHVVGIYIKTEPLHAADNNAITEEDALFNQQSQQLIDAPPTPDGLDYFITVSEKECT